MLVYEVKARVSYYEKLYVTFDHSRLLMQGQTPCNMGYTKVVIKRDETEYYINNFSEKRTYERKS